MRKNRFFAAVTAISMAAASLAGCGSGSSGAAGSDAASTAEREAASAESGVAADDAASAAEDHTSTAESAGSSEPLAITFVTPLLGNPVWLAAKQGAEDAAAERNALVNWVGPSDIDMDEQVRQIELAIAENVDGIICCPLSPAIFETVYQEALDKGIAVINTAVDTTEETRTAYIGTDYTNFGEQAARNLAEKLGGKGQVACLVTSLDTENQMSELEAGKALLEKEYPDVQIVVTETSNSDTAQAADKTSAILDTYPELSAVWCLESTSPLGVAQTLQERNMSEKILVLGIDDTEDVLDLIDQGMIWGTMTQDFYKMGYESVKMIAEVKDGGSVPSIQDSGTTLVTKENLEEYKARF